MSFCTNARPAPPITVTPPTTASRFTLEVPMLKPSKNTPYRRPTM